MKTRGSILTSATVNLTEGATAIADTGTLVNPFRQPMLLDEIRMVVQSPPGYAGDLGGSVRVEFKLGEMAMTNGFVPTWLFNCNSNTSLDTTAAVWPTIGGYLRYVVWHLPKPLYVPAGLAPIATYQRTYDGVGGTASVAMTYAGRIVAPGQKRPKTYDVPYVAFFAHTAGQTQSQSGSTDLYNQFRKPLHLQKLVGRYQAVIGGLLTDYNRGFSDPYVTLNSVHTSARFIWGSNVPFHAIFPFDRGQWLMHNDMPGQGAYIVSFSNVTVSTDVPMLSLVGWREEIPS